MEFIYEPSFYYTVVGTMFVLAALVYICLLRINVGYGMMYSPKWGPSVGNRLGWVLMEAPVVFATLAIWLTSPRCGEVAPVVMISVFLLHYIQRSFIFPFMIRGKNRMPLVIVLMGVIFNVVNAYMIAGWLFWVAPEGTYPVSWLWSPLFWLGLVIFGLGMYINLRSDYIIRHLRQPGDTRHYIPRGGMFRFVTSANYLGELTEWIGFAVMTWSLGGLAFAVWTFANLAPRARWTHKRYLSEFGDEYRGLNRKYIIPFIY